MSVVSIFGPLCIDTLWIGWVIPTSLCVWVIGVHRVGSSTGVSEGDRTLVETGEVVGYFCPRITFLYGFSLRSSSK